MVLPSERRLRSSRDFTEVMRRGLRAGRPTLSVHLVLGPNSSLASSAQPLETTHGPAPVPARAGIVVSKAVGNSVVRHRVARRLRHLLSDPLSHLPAGSRLVVRARPEAASATSTQLGLELTAALKAVRSKAVRSEPSS